MGMPTTIVNVRGLRPAEWLADPSHVYCGPFREVQAGFWPRSPFTNPFQVGVPLRTMKMILSRAGVDSAGLTEFLTQYEWREQTDRETIVACYRLWLPTEPELAKLLPTLAGKTLGCWCAPKPCHCDVLRDAVESGRFPELFPE